MTQAVHSPHFHLPAHSNQIRTASALNILAGVYFLVSEWIAAFNGAERANGIIFGIIVAILSATRFAGATGPWASWLNALIGLWVIISPWVYGYAGSGWMVNSIIVGIIMLVLGFWSASASPLNRNME